MNRVPFLMGIIFAIGLLVLPGADAVQGVPTAAGDLDLDFGGFSADGIIEDNRFQEFSVESLALQPDGKVIVVGCHEPEMSGCGDATIELYVARYHQDGSLDQGFGHGGVTIFAEADGFAYATDVLLQPDGKIVVVGQAGLDATDFLVIRLTPEGDFDASFGNDGVVRTDIANGELDFARAGVLMSGGDIAVAGKARVSSTDYAVVARYDSQGDLVSTFGDDGTLLVPIGSEAEARAVAVQGNKILLGGTYLDEGNEDFFVARLNADGSLDASFGADGIRGVGFGGVDTLRTLTVDPQNRIVAAGTSRFRVLVTRLLPDGALDTSFSDDGRAAYNLIEGREGASAVQVRADGRYWLAGWLGESGLLLRITQAGDLDTTFSEDGFTTIGSSSSVPPGTDMALLPDGNLVLGGAGISDNNIGLYDIGFLARLRPDGSPDAAGAAVTAFGSGNSSQAHGVALQADGKIVLAGRYSSSSILGEIALARYNADGSPDISFGEQGMAISEPQPPVGGATASHAGKAVVVSGGGEIVVAGDTYSFADELDPDDNNFNFALWRYSENDRSIEQFGVADYEGGDDFAEALSVQPDGKYIAAGFANVGGPGEYRLGLARWHPDGSPDATFGANGKVVVDVPMADAYEVALALQPGGKILVAGAYAADGGEPNFVVARLLPDGQLDTGFGNGGVVIIDAGILDYATAMTPLPDGKILVMGTINPGMFFRWGAVILNEDGTQCQDACGLPASNDYVLLTDIGGLPHEIAVQPNGRFVVVGEGSIRSTEKRFFAARFIYDSAGFRLDSEFGADGTATLPALMVNDTATAVALDGYDIYVGGFSDDGPAIGGRRAFALAKVDAGTAILESFLPLVIR